jgi:hypothetical protein
MVSFHFFINRYLPIILYRILLRIYYVVIINYNKRGYILGDTLANSNFKPVWIKKETKEDLEKIKVLLGFNDYDSLIKAFIIDKIDIDVKIKSNILKKELC